MNENNLEEPLAENNAKKELVLKFSQGKPFVDVNRPDSDSNYLSNEKKQLWFDDVSPTSSNPILSDDDVSAGAGEEKKPANLCTKTIETVLFIFF